MKSHIALILSHKRFFFVPIFVAFQIPMQVCVSFVSILRRTLSFALGTKPSELSKKVAEDSAMFVLQKIIRDAAAGGHAVSVGSLPFRVWFFGSVLHGSPFISFLQAFYLATQLAGTLDVPYREKVVLKMIDRGIAADIVKLVEPFFAKKCEAWSESDVDVVDDAIIPLKKMSMVTSARPMLRKMRVSDFFRKIFKCKSFRDPFRIVATQVLKSVSLKLSFVQVFFSSKRESHC